MTQRDTVQEKSTTPPRSTKTRTKDEAAASNRAEKLSDTAQRSGQREAQRRRVERKTQRYLRPRRYVSWTTLVIGLVIGLAAGLGYAWVINPVVEFNTEPWQLNETDRQQYVVAIMLSHGQHGDLAVTFDRLLALRPQGDPFESVAEVACDLASTGYVDSTSGLRAIRQMMTFYQLQDKSGCADVLIPVDAMQSTQVVEIAVPTPTLIPPATKTPTPEPPSAATPTQPRVIVPTSPPQSAFVLANVQTFCSENLSGLIEVNVVDFNAQGIPGQAVRVRWDDGDDTFFTGLKPERGPGYADFSMAEGISYTVDMPGRANPIRDPLAAVPCTTETGQQAVTSYRVWFREQ